MEETLKLMIGNIIMQLAAVQHELAVTKAALEEREAKLNQMEQTKNQNGAG